MAWRVMADELSKEEPPSPDPPFWGSNYTPSQESQDVQDFIGRRRLRILNGQDPEKMPDKFTPLVNLLKFEWPKNENARQWASSKPWDDETTWSRNCKPNKRQKKLALAGWRHEHHACDRGDGCSCSQQLCWPIRAIPALSVQSNQSSHQAVIKAAIRVQRAPQPVCAATRSLTLVNSAVRLHACRECTVKAGTKYGR